MTAQSQYQPYFAHLRSLNFHFLDTWVIECVNYYKSNNPSISVEDLKNEVKQQWLLVNLREIKVPSLPFDLQSKEHIVLNGTYAVQVESMIDSSVSCYSQFQELLKIDTENVEVTRDPSERSSKSNRCLTFKICDGVQELQAMEYQPIKKIRTNDPELLPGFKMLIVGPVECRKGMILLKDENVRLCGGEVDTLAVTNSLKSILIKRLDLDESDYPDSVCSNFEEIDREPQSSVNVSGNLDEGCVENLLSQNDDLFLTLPLETEILGQGSRPTETISRYEENESDMFIGSVSDSNENGLNQWSSSSKNKKRGLPEDIVTSSQKRLSLDAESENSATEPTKWNLGTNIDNESVFDSQPKPHQSTLQTKQQVQTKLSSFFKTNDLGLNHVSRTSNKPQTPLIVSCKPFVYLRQILSADLNKADIYTIKGSILTLKKKITIENDEFNLKVTITDGSASIDVEFLSEILEELLGFSPSEMTVMMKARQGNTAIAERVKEAFLKTQEKLISLNCLMKIKFFKNGRCPLILLLEEVTVDHLNALKERRLEM